MCKCAWLMDNCHEAHTQCRPLGVRLWIEPLLQCRICMASGPQGCTCLRWLSQSSKNEGPTCTNVQNSGLSLTQVLIAFPNKLLHGRKGGSVSKTESDIYAKSFWTQYRTLYSTMQDTQLAFHLEGFQLIVQPHVGHEPRPGTWCWEKLMAGVIIETRRLEWCICTTLDLITEWCIWGVWDRYDKVYIMHSWDHNSSVGSSKQGAIPIGGWRRRRTVIRAAGMSNARK